MNVPLLDLTAQYRRIREPVRAAIDVVCDNQALVLGEAVTKFEKRLADYCGTKYALGLSSGTDALIAAMMCMDIGPGDEVIVPSFTFFATGGCVSRLGATPVFVDINPKTFNIDVDQVADKVTPRTKAIMPVHLFGQVADVKGCNEIACDPKRDRPIWVIEDAAQAIGAKRDGKPACAHGFCGALSFYPTKNLGAFGDAGAVCGDDDEFFARLKKCRVHGSGHTYYHEFVGGNFRIDAIQAAVLDVKLDYLDSWHAGRRRNAEIYDEILGDSGVVTPYVETGCESVYNQYVIRIPAGVADRDAVKQRLAQRGVGSGIYYPLGLHQQECFGDLGYAPGDLPETMKAAREVLALPIYPELSEEQVRYAATEVVEALAQGGVKPR